MRPLLPDYFYKYCNCYNNNEINAECYDTVLEAIYTHEERDKLNTSSDSRLVILNKYYPEFLQKKFIQWEFSKFTNICSKPVVFESKMNFE